MAAVILRSGLGTSSIRKWSEKRLWGPECDFFEKTGGLQISHFPVMIDENRAAYCVSLIYAWLMNHPEYYSTYVQPYTQLRYCHDGVTPTVCAVKVGGHYRRRAAYKNLIPALGSVCKFERLCVPRGLGTPLIAYRTRWEEDGSIIPLRYRQLQWA